MSEIPGDFDAMVRIHVTPEMLADPDGRRVVERKAGEQFDELAAMARRGELEGRAPVILEPGRQITDPDEAEALGLTVEARRMREGRL